MATPLFSVIVPTHGRPAYLAEALASVAAQTIGDWEALVVDDASPEPVEIPDDPRFRLVRRDENGGPGAARNSGLAAATGRYIAFLDDDDLFTPDRLEVALEGLQRAPVAICFNHYIGAPPKGGRVLEGMVHDTIGDHMAPHLGRTAVERAVAPAFDERFTAAEDVEWWIRLSREAAVTTVPRFAYLVRRHPGPRTHTGLENRVRCRFMLLELHAGYFAEHPRAAAFQWKRIGLMASSLGDHRLARRAFRRSLRLNPEPRTAWHLARSTKPSRTTLRTDPPADVHEQA